MIKAFGAGYTRRYPIEYAVLYHIPKVIKHCGAYEEVMSSTVESTPSKPIQLRSETDLDEAISTYDLVLVDFYADWCGPCQMMEPTINALAAETDAAILKVDVDRFQRVASQYDVQGIPALMLFANGELAERFVGVQQRETLEAAIQQYTP